MYFFIVPVGKRASLTRSRISMISWDFSWHLPHNTLPFIKKGIECSLQQVYYGEFGWDAKEIIG
jgi:hypothetical protein